MAKSQLTRRPLFTAEHAARLSASIGNMAVVEAQRAMREFAESMRMPSYYFSTLSTGSTTYDAWSWAYSKKRRQFKRGCARCRGSGWWDCPECNGSGDDGPYKCQHCAGSGQEKCYCHLIDCLHCEDTGRRPCDCADYEGCGCLRCDGEGFVRCNCGA